MNTKHNFARLVLLIAVIAVQGLTPASALAAPVRSTTSSTTMPADLYQAVLNSTTHNDPSLQSSNGTYHFSTNGLNAALSFSGLTLNAQNGNSWNWNVQVNGFGRGANPQAASAALSSDSKNGTATQHYTGFSQWMRATGIGLEQGFTVDQSPQGNGTLVLRMALNTNLNGNLSKDSRSLTFNTGDGKTLYYSNLRVFDAKSKELDAKLVYTPKQIIIQVDDANAVYPLTIDPLIYFETKVVSMDGTAYDQFGVSVAISGDTAIVGASAMNSSTGAAYIYQRSGLIWSQQAELSASDGVSLDHFGTSVAISGNTAIVGAPDQNSLQGKAYVFVEPGGGWTNMTETAQLTASDGAANDQFGSSVAISGGTAIVGAQGKTISGHFGQGKAYVFVESGGSWSNMAETADLAASDGAANNSFGSSVAISGNTAIVGARGWNSSQGKAYVFVEPGGGWATAPNPMNETARLTSYDSLSGDGFGSSVAISGDMAIVGAPSKAYGGIPVGAAYIFVKPGGSWATTSSYTAELYASDGAAGDQFGLSVAISGDTAIVGAAGENFGLGKAYVFVKPPSGWATNSETAGLTASDGAFNDAFGIGVAISGDTAIVGAWGKTVGSNVGQGAAYMYFPYSTQDLAVQAMTSSAAPTWGPPITLTASVTNFGTSSAPAVALSAPLPSGFNYVGNTASFGYYDPASGVWSVGTLASGATATLNIQTSPSSSIAGTQAVFTASLLGADINPLNNSSSVTMNLPLVRFLPGPVNFGTELIQNADAPVTVQVQNMSADDITLGTLSVSPGFLLSSNFCTGAALDPGEACNFNVQFKPLLANGYVYSGHVSVSFEGLSAIANLPLSGTGLGGTKLPMLNPSFEVGPSAPPSGWSKSGTWVSADGRDCTTAYTGVCSLSFTGTNVLKSLSQSISHSGSAGDDFLFSIWSKAASVPGGTTFAVVVLVRNGPTLVDALQLQIPTGTHAFTKYSLPFTATGPYTSVTITPEYKGSAGTVWFDNANLVWAP